MTQVIGFENKKHKHKTTCLHCGAIVEFDNSDIISDEMGMCVICPNCNHDIKF